MKRCCRYSPPGIEGCGRGCVIAMAAAATCPHKPLQEKDFGGAVNGFNFEESISTSQQSKGAHQRKKCATICSIVSCFCAAGLIGFFVFGPLLKQARAPSHVAMNHGHRNNLGKTTAKFQSPLMLPRGRPTPARPMQVVPPHAKGLATVPRASARDESPERVPVDPQVLLRSQVQDENGNVVALTDTLPKSSKPGLPFGVGASSGIVIFLRHLG